MVNKFDERKMGDSQTLTTVTLLGSGPLLSLCGEKPVPKQESRTDLSNNNNNVCTSRRAVIKSMLLLFIYTRTYTYVHLYTSCKLKGTAQHGQHKLCNSALLMQQ